MISNYQVRSLDTDEVCAVFPETQEGFAIDLADRLAAQSKLGERFAVMKVSLIHATPKVENDRDNAL